MSLLANGEVNKTQQTMIDERIFGKKVGLMGKLFGCWHNELSRPFKRSKTSYRVCLSCGARKQFDDTTFRTFGGFYHPPIVRKVAEV